MDPRADHRTLKVHEPLHEHTSIQINWEHSCRCWVKRGCNAPMVVVVSAAERLRGIVRSRIVSTFMQYRIFATTWFRYKFHDLFRFQKHKFGSFQIKSFPNSIAIHNFVLQVSFRRELHRRYAWLEECYVFVRFWTSFTTFC